MKYIEESQLKDSVKALYSTSIGTSSKSAGKIRVYESAEEFLSCNNTVTNEAIEKRTAEKVEAYNNLPAGPEKEAITNAINGMYVGMDRDPSKKTPTNYYTDKAIIELYNEENQKRETLLTQATPVKDEKCYILVSHDYDRYSGGDFAVGTFTSLEALNKVMAATETHYREIGGDLGNKLKVVDMNGRELNDRTL